MSDQFDWESAELVCGQVGAIAVYLDECEYIVIRQQNLLAEQDDVVEFPASMAKAVIDAIKAATRK